MTLEEAVQAAESGDVKAMYALGNHYYQEKEFIDACEWFDRAACSGHTESFPLAMMTNTIAALIIQEMGLWQRALDYWQNALKWCGAIFQKPDLFADQTKDLASEKFKDSIYGICYNFYRMEQFSDAMKLLRNELDTDNRYKLLFGLCVFASYGDDAVTGIKEAYHYLTVAETDCPDVADDLIFQSLMLLANLYRHAHTIQVPGVRADIERAYRCVTKAAALPGEIGTAAQEELKKYSKGLFGSYTYNG